VGGGKEEREGRREMEEGEGREGGRGRGGRDQRAHACEMSLAGKVHPKLNKRNGFKQNYL
jgi:hypothetical protein